MKTQTKIILDSIIDNKRVTTFEVKVPLLTWVQILTHRDFSRNAASNRAIPTEKLIESSDFTPETWRKNDRGMSPSEYLSEKDSKDASDLWSDAMNIAHQTARKLSELGVHKEQANRVLAPFLWVKGLITSTRWDNFIQLRTHESTQEETREVALAVQAYFKEVGVNMVERKQYHVPFIREGEQFKTMTDFFCVSSARCARVSYDSHDGNSSTVRDAALAIRLLDEGHMSPFEHVACSTAYLNLMKHHRAFDYAPRSIEEFHGNLDVVQFRKILEHPVNRALVIDSLLKIYHR